MNSIEQLFNEVSEKIINFDREDVIFISEFIDEVESMKVFFIGDVWAENLISFLCSKLKTNFARKNDEHIVETLTNGVELLQRLSNNRDDNDKKRIYQQIDEFTSGQKVETEERNPKSKDTIEVGTYNTEPLEIFIVEAIEKMSDAQNIILDLEGDLTNKEKINELFRIFHTIKGECGFLKIATLGELAHNIENILDLVRDNKVTLNVKIIDKLLQGIDLSKEIISRLKEGKIVIFNDILINDYIDSIKDITKNYQTSIGEVLIENDKLTQNEVNNILEEQKLSVYTKKFGEIAMERSYLNKNDIEDGLAKQHQAIKEEEQSKKTKKNDQIIKVRASKINYIVDMIGELLIVQSQISDHSPAFSQIKKITRTLQYSAMQLRTEQIKILFNNSKRVIRDISQKLGKPINVEFVGEELEVDRNLIENLEEPIMHLIRNAISHGIESVEDRIKKNKNREGKITLEAERRGNKIIISVTDDGSGLNKEKILKKALSKKIIKKESIENMTDEEIYNLIFIEGFSTVENIDYVSGRGVGMDIVKSTVASLKGIVEVNTQKDCFSRFSMIFPLNTAIIDGMIVKLGNNLLIVPVTSIVTLLKVKKEAAYRVINNIDVIKLREETIPVVYLNEYFEMGKIERKDLIGIIVENIDKKKYFFCVDEILVKREVVIKSLGKRFNNLKGISSGAVLSEGRIGLVLDIDQIIGEYIKNEEFL